MSGVHNVGACAGAWIGFHLLVSNFERLPRVSQVMYTIGVGALAIIATNPMTAENQRLILNFTTTAVAIGAVSQFDQYLAARFPPIEEGAPPLETQAPPQPAPPPPPRVRPQATPVEMPPPIEWGPDPAGMPPPIEWGPDPAGTRPPIESETPPAA